MKLTIERCIAVTTVLVVVLMMPVCLYADSADTNTEDTGSSVRDTPSAEPVALEATKGRVKAQESVNALSKDIQDLKLSVIALNKDLRVLEEDLLFPADTQVNVFVSLDIGKYFTLESVKLKIDDKEVTSHIYTDKELSALSRGGIQKLHMANLSAGEHTMSAFFTGMGPNNREYKRGTTLRINKENGPKYVELKIADSTAKLQPEFSVKEW